MEHKNSSGNPLVAAIHRVQDIVLTVVENPTNAEALFSLRLSIEKADHIAREKCVWDVARKATECSQWAHRDLRERSVLETLDSMVNGMLMAAHKAEQSDSAMRVSMTMPVVSEGTVAGLQTGWF
jgi:hypothetical protein